MKVQPRQQKAEGDSEKQETCEEKLCPGLKFLRHSFEGVASAGLLL